MSNVINLVNHEKQEMWRADIYNPSCTASLAQKSNGVNNFPPIPSRECKV